MKGSFERYSYNVASGVEAIFANRVKSFLTALGIIFGVAAVISMLAIGNGAEQEILEQIKMVGVVQNDLSSHLFHLFRPHGFNRRRRADRHESGRADRPSRCGDLAAPRRVPDTE